MNAISSQTVVQEQAETLSQAAIDYARIERALQFLNDNYLRRPTLDEVSAHIHLSRFHFERLFQRWAGTSPKRFLQCLTKEHAKALLRESVSLLDTAYESGLSGPGRLHDLFVSCEAVTPGEFRQRGLGMTIRYGIHPTPFGICLLAITERGICALRFLSKNPRRRALEELREEWFAARFIEEQNETGALCQQIFGGTRRPFHLHLRGTNFQLKVWQALLMIPYGKLVSYGKIAAMVGAPNTHRAVGSAIGRNPMAYLIPCHRVIKRLGVFGEYRWGHVRKQAIIGWEGSATVTTAPSGSAVVN
jgi:AraC family transcriptional regulator, regulatory protein of adaptative response / methylated-DNA-[protein]-cysteine methyltransferase